MADLVIPVENFADLKQGRKDFTLQALNDAEREGPELVIKDGFSNDKDRWERAGTRMLLRPVTLRQPNEEANEQRLTTPRFA